MHSKPKTPPQLIQSEHELAEVLPELASTTHLAVDTESNSLYAYQEQVCLIQFSTRDQDLLIDPLSIPDLSSLDSVFSNPKVEKILHGAEYDVICLARDFDFILENLFDTRTACRTLGYKRSGLGDLVEEIVGVKINKRFQRANWGRRPLPRNMLDYARLDTHYLIPLRERLTEQLLAAGRWQEFHELSQRKTTPLHQENGFDPDGFWHISNARKLKPQQRAVLRELYLLRDQLARRLDRPTFKVVPDHALIEMAKTAPRSKESLQDIKGVSSRWIRDYGDDLIQAVRAGKKAKPPSKPSYQGMGDAAHERFEALRNWRKLTARKHKVESDLILPRDLMESLANQAPQQKEDLQRLMEPLEWRFQQFGDEILTILTS
ncbi:MAG: HRDC domain-containing protein [Anaerolineales bacterium]|jgi:ribonuclease D